MGSRLKLNPERTFYWFFEAMCPVARDKDPSVQFMFPEDFADEESCQTLPRFCFPYDIQRARDGVAVQHFTFALTDLEGCQRFGFCRLANTSQTCLCILSYLPWFEVFYKLLNNLADYLAKGQTNEARTLLSELYKQPVPLVSGSVTLSMGEQVLVNEVSLSVGHPEAPEGVPYFIAPDPRSLPSIPESRNLTELIVAVDVGNLLQLYASMLFERRILIFASKLSTLTSCVHALTAVLYPMHWQHIFIPVLPPNLLDYCCAPMPYLIGVHTSLSEKVKSRGLEEVVILNVDTNTVETPFDDLKRIPPDVMSQLKMTLKRQAVSPGCGVSRAFLRAQALLFGGYREALCTQNGEISFNEDLFLDHKSNNMRQFLQSAVHLQFFKQFIDSRLEILNKGQEPDDLFEEEIENCEASPGKSRSYQQFVGNIRKGGGALILNVKSNMKAKGLTKSGLKNLLNHKSHNEEASLQRGGSMSHRHTGGLQARLATTRHFGKSRPVRPMHKYRVLRDEESIEDTHETWDRVELKHDDHEEEEEVEDPLLCDPEEMDLLGEIFDTLSSRSSHERGLLYGTRSLDLFGPDSHDFITKCSLINPSQESLCASGTGSLQSWNLETAEELSDFAQESDEFSLEKCKTEEEEETPIMSAHEDLHSSPQDEAKQMDNNEDNLAPKIVVNGADLERDCDIKKDENIHVAEKDLSECKEQLQKSNENQTIENDPELEQNKKTDTCVDHHEASLSHVDVVEAPKQVQPKTLPIQTTPPPPKVHSATARFQCHPRIQGPDLKSRMKTLAEAGGHLHRKENQSDTEEEKDLPPVKVSELKKRFEI
ncbi:DENN domain-containing protein 1B isoform X2 [Boleophthalmus pectinirostris]|uniref:DENN domain-containing protein 1B isoform X2 n=1 Tax=Boleophthalmus pectinirostris TaxID=150288 RepID=UPI000A1C62AA|nr:DENN domain-containing protein 1B isoform X2 [Boleophthalmus pectinirostris]